MQIVKYLYILTMVVSLKILSYNSWGAMSSSRYISELLVECDILCIQEHHLYPENIAFLSTISTDFKCDALVDKDNSNIFDIFSRKRKGGVAIMWHKNIDHIVSKVNLDQDIDRINGIKIQEKGNIPVYLFNVYMPSTNSDIQEYIAMIRILQGLYDYYSQYGMVIIAGDMNGQLGPEYGPRAGTSQSERGRYLMEFIQSNFLISTVADDCCTGPVGTFYPHMHSSSTQIDHFVIPRDKSNFIHGCKVWEYEALNTSDHAPVQLSMNYNIKRVVPKGRVLYDWPRADKYKYSNTLDMLISQEGHLVSEPNTIQDIDLYANALTQCLINATQISVPCKKHCPYKRPYWDSDLKIVYAEQKSKRRAWVALGKPRGMHHGSYKEYKVAKRAFGKLLLKKETEHELAKYNNIDQMADIDSRKFWKLTRSKNNSYIGNHAIDYNGKTYSEPDDLKDVWCTYYKELLNEQLVESKLYDNEFCQNIDESVNLMERTYSKSSDNTGVLSFPITEYELTNLCKEFHNDKAAGFDGITYENLKYAGVTFIKKTDCII